MTRAFRLTASGDVAPCPYMGRDYCVSAPPPPFEPLSTIRLIGHHFTDGSKLAVLYLPEGTTPTAAHGRALDAALAKESRRALTPSR